MSENWYVARNGQRIGPFTFEQFREMGAAGQLSATDMVFQEGTIKWVAAGLVEGLLPQPRADSEKPLAPPVDSRKTQATSGNWYYAMNGQRFGPFTFENLRQMVHSGVLAPVTMVVNLGVTQWASAGTVEGLFPSPGLVLYFP